MYAPRLIYLRDVVLDSESYTSRPLQYVLVRTRSTISYASSLIGHCQRPRALVASLEGLKASKLSAHRRVLEANRRLFKFGIKAANGVHSYSNNRHKSYPMGIKA